MGETYYGATRAEWEAFARLTLPDILPTVTDPRVRLHPDAKRTGAALDKTPSFVGADGYGRRFSGWPSHVTKGYAAWAADPRLGICVIARTLRAIDIDVDSQEVVDRIHGLIWSVIKTDLPIRTRSNTGKCLLIYRLADVPDDGVKKGTLPIPGFGAIEFLHEKQQYRVAGMHATGVRLEWPDGIPASITEVPVLTLEQVIEIQRVIAAFYNPLHVSEVLSNGVTYTNRSPEQVDPDDPVVKYLYEHHLVRSLRPDGALNVYCPWELDHKHPTPDNDSEATFFPQGLGGNEAHPGFICQHETCQGRNHQSFLDEIGYTAQEIPLLPAIGVAPRPPVSCKRKSGVIEATLPNIVALLGWNGFGYSMRYDRFKDSVVYHNAVDTTWQLLSDDTYTSFRLRLNRIGMEPNINLHDTRNATSFVAREKTVDTAQEWLTSLQWDGTQRIATFHTDVLRLPDTPYHRACVLYLWTALAGRLLDPGCKADMVPILQGAQGLRKSTFVKELVPSPGEYVALNMAHSDADLSRQLRGKMVAEWEELRGMASRDAEALKAWVSRQVDEWVPKYKEFGTSLPRRFVIIGTANERRVLTDTTGARRWLPIQVKETINTERLTAEREQLWAEARELWTHKGVLWQNAENLARKEHGRAMVRDIWEDVIVGWLDEQPLPEGSTSMQILTGACGLTPAQANKNAYQRLRQVMARIGYTEHDDGTWVSDDLT